MKYVHWIAYPALIAVILFLTYTTLEQAVWLDHLKQGSKSDDEAMADLLRYIEVNSDCDKSPQQLATAMGKEYEVIESSDLGPKGSAVAHLSFLAKYDDDQLVGVEDTNHGKVVVCSDKRAAQ